LLIRPPQGGLSLSVIIIVMGVQGAGKTTVGSLLAHELDFEFQDADNFHSAANIEKMRRGTPLTDSDRAPWLAALHDAITHWLADKRNVVLACSALKAIYRDRLLVSPEVKLVYLKATYDLILSRLKLRHGHYAGENLLHSQFADLEEPTAALTVDASRPPNELARQLLETLRP
jgi:gluconokinase